MTLRLTPIPAGNAGILYTAERMREHIARYSPAVRAQAVRILWGLPPGSGHFAQAAMIHQWVQDHLLYVNDHATVEELRDPENLLAEIAYAGRAAADCDCWIILEGALLTAVGIPVTLILTSGREDQEFDHVFLAADTDIGRVYADGIHGAPLGWHIPWGVVTNLREVSV